MAAVSKDAHPMTDPAIPTPAQPTDAPTIRVIAMPADANPAGDIFGGWLMGQMDLAAATIATRRAQGRTATQSEEMLNKKSGLLGLSGVSSDMREILKAANDDNHRALLALKTYCYRVRKYIGAYVASMGGLDAIVFTGGIGQGSAEVRALALQGLDCMGIKLDDERNLTARGFDEVCRITSDDSKIAVLVVPTDEERMMAREAMRTVSRQYITSVLKAQKQQSFLVEVSAHHIHLTQEHVEALFGKGHQLTKHADLSQPGQYACKEQLAIVGPKGKIERVRVLGPARKYTQIEIAMTEQFKIGVHPPIRESGDIADTPGCTLESPTGSVKVDRGVICALRHVHMTPEDALRYGVRDKSFVRVRINSDRELVFGDVLVRVDPGFALAMHIDTDEANASDAYKQAIMDATSDDIVYSNLFTGVPGNYLAASIRNAGLDPDKLPSAERDYAAGAPKPWKDIWGSGQGVGAVDQVVPAQALIARLAAEYRAARARLDLSH